MRYRATTCPACGSHDLSWHLGATGPYGGVVTCSVICESCTSVVQVSPAEEVIRILNGDLRINQLIDRMGVPRGTRVEQPFEQPPGWAP